MGLLNSLFSAVSGLQNQQVMMDVIGDNIANVNTIGFKSSRVTFSDTFNEFMRAGTNPTATSGGTNSFQVGLGVRVNSIDRNWNQGTFQSTGINTDLALQGPGLFILKNNGETQYSRAGSFLFDANGNLVNSQNGAIVQGKIANADGVIPPGNNLEDIKIDTNSNLPAVATQNISWGGNLQSNSALTRSENALLRGNINSSLPGPFTSQTTVYNEYGDPYTLKVTYTKTGNPDEYNMNWDVLNSSDTSVGSGSINGLKFADDGTGNYVLDAASLAKFDGTQNRVNLGSDNIDFLIDANNVTENSSTSTLNIVADDNRQPNVISGAVTVYDSLGTTHQATIKFTKIGDNTWDWTVSVPASSTANNVVASTSGTVTFNADGSLDSKGITPSDPQFTFQPSGGANAVSINLNFGEGISGITQNSGGSVISALSQDGSTSASLSNINIDQHGNIVGVYSNGTSKSLAQIMTATFTNLQGLTSVGDNMYSAFANSGEARIGSLGEDTATTVQSGVLEQSNVDLSQEFTKMIISQRGFQANARVITTSDAILQEITNLIR